MNAKKLMFAAAALWFGSSFAGTAQQGGPAVPERLQVTTDTQATSAPVSKYLYGQFIEHIGGTMYSSLWAEMLDDRKFYFPITAKKPETSGQPQGGPFRMRLRKWHPVGPENVVSMDKRPAVCRRPESAYRRSTPPRRTASSKRALLCSMARSTPAGFICAELREARSRSR